MTALFTKVPPQLPVGEGTCKIAFVGEAPSDFERLYGFPLVGPSGRTFDQLLRVAGLSCSRTYHVPSRAKRVASLLGARSEFLVTNVFDEQIPDNDVKNWCAPAPERKEWGEDYSLERIGGAGYLRPERLHHLARLAAELRAAAPNVVVPLGGTALWALTGISDITLARGVPMTASLLVPGQKLLPTFHPEYVRQNWTMFQIVVGDLMKAAAEAEFPELRSVQREIEIRPTSSDLQRWKQELLKAECLAVDIETAKGQITCIGFAPSPWKAYVVPFVDYEAPSRNYWCDIQSELDAWQMVREVCESRGPVKVLQNGLYDAYYLIWQAGIWLQNYSCDLRLQHHALYPELPKSLAFMGATYTNPPGPWKTMRERKEKKDD